MHCALCNGILWRWLICQVGGCPFPIEHLSMKRKQIFKLFSGLQTTFWKKLSHISLLRRRCLKQNRIIVSWTIYIIQIWACPYLKCKMITISFVKSCMLEYNPIQDDANVRIEWNSIWNDADISSNNNTAYLSAFW